MNKWDSRFFEMAKVVASWSKDPSTQVGAVIVDDKNRLLSIGYNGFPRGIDDSSERYEDRELKYKIVVHAEENAILNATTSLEGSTLYLTPLACCSNCVSRILQAGIKCVKILENAEKMKDRDYSLSFEMLREAGVEVQVFQIE